MEFEAAANRLKSDHANLRSNARKKRINQSLSSKKDTTEMKKREEYRKKQLEKKRQKEKEEKMKLDYVKSRFNSMESQLGIERMLEGDVSRTDSLILEATSIYGQGDKITLPPSLLSTLAERDLLRKSQERNQPLFFRLGIKREGYIFPSSERMQKIMTEKQFGITSQNSDDINDKHMEDGFDDDDDDLNQQTEWELAYLEELSHEYISYVYATVVEFTQEEGYIGLPLSIATSLLQKHDEEVDGNRASTKVPRKLTVDPAMLSTSDGMNVESSMMETENEKESEEELEHKTPGHPAYGLFHVPSQTIEVLFLTNLPLGKKCTLQPTRSAIENGFYNLKDVKVVLEQSLIRTRGCLNVGDVMHCWNRGKKFDLKVKDVTPSHVRAVSCVNTDVEVDIAAVDDDDGENENMNEELPKMQHTSSDSLSGKTSGYRLSDDTSNGKEPVNHVKSGIEIFDRVQMDNIPPEPSIDKKENVVMIQIRGEGGKQCRRRFDSSVCNIKHIFMFALTQGVVVEGAGPFRLITRFPRRVFHLEEDGDTSLLSYNFANQELFVVEKL